MQYAYGNTAVGSPLRHLAVDLCAYVLETEYMAEHSEELPKELLLQVVLQMGVSEREKSPDGVYVRKGKSRVYTHNRTERSYLVSEGECLAEGQEGKVT